MRVNGHSIPTANSKLKTKKMAVLEKIRKRTVFLILVIGLALFAFVISGIFSRNTTPDQLVIGSVNGDDISYREFST